MAVDTKELYEIREKSLKVEVSMINGAKLEERLNTKREDILELLEDVGSISEVTKKLVENEKDLEILKNGF